MESLPGRNRDTRSLRSGVSAKWRPGICEGPTSSGRDAGRRPLPFSAAPSPPPPTLGPAALLGEEMDTRASVSLFG